jgi:hypothetical protein
MIAEHAIADADLWQSVADVVRPRVAVAPSAWAEANVVLSLEQSESRPGNFSCDWKPWTRAVHDLLHDEPHKAGVVCMKPARVGFTRAVMNLIGCLCETRPGNILYLINNVDQASYWATEHFDPLIRQVPGLRKAFTVGEGRRETTIQRPYNGGRVDFSGSGSVSGVISRGYVYVFLDEYDTILDEFPIKKTGSPWGMAEGRVKEARDRSQIWGWSHPRRAGDGIDGLYRRITDRRAWVFDCPHCRQTIRPHSSQIKMETNESGELEPDSAVFACEHCGAAIDDQDRARQTWPAKLGGSGRFESELEPEIAKSREYIGLAINGLADPYVTVRELATARARCNSEADLQAFLNIRMGEPYTPASAVVTTEVVKDRIRAMEQIAVPGGELGCVLLTCGGDVQAPESNPTIYLRTTAWTVHAHAFVFYHKVSGWAALSEYLSRLAVPVSGEGGEIESSLVPQVCSLDCGAFTGQVLDYCRQDVRSVHNNQRIELLPLRFMAHIKSTEPAIMPSEKKRIDPARPWLGPQRRYDLHRHTWVGREMSRWTEGRITVIGTAPADLPSHITANVLEPVKDVHGWGSPDLVWAKQKDRRDDWAMAGAYDEAGAVLTQQLDRLHELIVQLRKPQQERPEVGQGWIGKAKLRERWW